ncbi:MAG TPA: 3-phosphoshikimate 1-carboxyvinyltransferase [Pyrinomonadaceae bacterium]|nr:3-phosphoshikimate 1-carboxyvinyltransferase [Pyrinomonadaceae bacterium]
MKLTRARSISGRLRLPGDKSISHRAALIAALAHGKSEVSNFSTARDCASTLACLRSLGVSIEHKNDRIVFDGSQKLAAPREPLDCGNSGSTLRILAGVLAGHDFTAELVGDESLSSRPMRRIIEPLEMMGARIESRDGKAPLIVHGAKEPSPISYALPVASAQVKSAVLFAGLNARGRTSVIEATQSRDHTERLFNGFGVRVTTTQGESSTQGRPQRAAPTVRAETTISVEGPARFEGGAIRVPGDVSSAAYFVAAAMLLPQSRLTIEGVGLNPTRAAFLSVLKTWGADVETTDVETERNEPYGTINVRGGITGNANESERTLGQAMIPSLIDELPLLAVVGSQIEGGIRIRDASELRLKESDRLATTAANLRAMGADVEEFPDGLSVSGPAQLRGTLLDAHGDHRIAMAFAVAALLAEGETEISGAECVAVSFPEFFHLLDSLIQR